jgi:hypothetical protein
MPETPVNREFSYFEYNILDAPLELLCRLGMSRPFRFTNSPRGRVSVPLNLSIRTYDRYHEMITILRATSCKVKPATELRPDGACGVEADSFRHPLTPHRNSKKSAAHSPYENQRSIAAMTAARRRGEFFVRIREKLSAILSNLSKLLLFGMSPAGVVFMRIREVKGVG